MGRDRQSPPAKHLRPGPPTKCHYQRWGRTSKIGANSAIGSLRTTNFGFASTNARACASYRVAVCLPAALSSSLPAPRQSSTCTEGSVRTRGPATDLSQHLDLALTPHAGIACDSTSATSSGFVWFTRHQSRKMPAVRSPRCTQRPLNAFDKIIYFKRLTKQARCTGRGCSALQVFFCVCSNQHNWNR